MLQLLVRERVVDLRGVHVVGRDVRLAVRHLARATRGHGLAPVRGSPGWARPGSIRRRRPRPMRGVLDPPRPARPPRSRRCFARSARCVSGSNSTVGSATSAYVARGFVAACCAVPGGDLGALRGRAAALVEVAAHLQPGDGERRYAQRAVEHRIEREALDPAVRDHVGRLRVGLDRHGPRAMPDRISITAVAIANRPSEATVWTGRWTAPSWSGHVLVEDARALFEVLGRADERVDLPCGRRCRRPRTRPARPRTSAPCRRPPTWWGRSRTSRSRPPRLAAPSPRLYRVGVQDVVWTPSPEYVERANVTRFMRAHGIATYEELVGAVRRRHRVVLGRRGP